MARLRGDKAKGRREEDDLFQHGKVRVPWVGIEIMIDLILGER